MRKILTLLTVVCSVMIMGTTSTAFAAENSATDTKKSIENIDSDLNIDGMSLKELTDAAIDIGNKLGGNIETDDSPLMQTLKEFTEALKQSAYKFDGVPNIDGYKPMWSYSDKENNKVIDIVRTDNGDMYAIFYSVNETIKFNGNPLLSFLYDSIYKGTGLVLG